MEKQNENDTTVELKPIFGIRPGVYLTILYSFIILLVLFALLVQPGLKNPTAILIVKTEPAAAAIRINDIYMGISGSKIRIQQGTHTIEAVMPGFESENTVLSINARIFGSNFFPRRYNLEFTFKTNDPGAAFAVYAADYAAWTFMGEPSATWQIPMSLSEGAYRVGPYGNTAELQDILGAAARFTVTKAALRDLIRAKLLLDNNGNVPTAATLFKSLSCTLTFLSQTPDSAGWILDMLQTSSAVSTAERQFLRAIEASDWFKTSFVSQRIYPIHGRVGERQLSLLGLRFTSIPQTMVMNGNSGTIVNTFLISETPVPRSLFDTFLAENPQWREHHTDYVPHEISFYPLDAYRDVITGITWYAANAFCEWLSARLPQSMAGMEVRLPFENEWLAASQGILNMRNPGWEWCADPYAHLFNITAAPEAIEKLGSTERVLRGRPSAASSENRASLPPDLSSPFVTFRPIIAEKK
jgi:hypothetical protein